MHAKKSNQLQSSSCKLSPFVLPQKLSAREHARNGRSFVCSMQVDLCAQSRGISSSKV